MYPTDGSSRSHTRKGSASSDDDVDERSKNHKSTTLTSGCSVPLIPHELPIIDAGDMDKKLKAHGNIDDEKLQSKGDKEEKRKAQDDFIGDSREAQGAQAYFPHFSNQANHQLVLQQELLLALQNKVLNEEQKRLLADKLLTDAATDINSNQANTESFQALAAAAAARQLTDQELHRSLHQYRLAREASSPSLMAALSATTPKAASAEAESSSPSIAELLGLQSFLSARHQQINAPSHQDQELHEISTAVARQGHSNNSPLQHLLGHLPSSQEHQLRAAIMAEQSLRQHNLHLQREQLMIQLQNQIQQQMQRQEEQRMQQKLQQEVIQQNMQQQGLVSSAEIQRRLLLQKLRLYGQTEDAPLSATALIKDAQQTPSFHSAYLQPPASLLPNMGNFGPIAEQRSQQNHLSQAQQRVPAGLLSSLRLPHPVFMGQQTPFTSAIAQGATGGGTAIINKPSHSYSTESGVAIGQGQTLEHPQRKKNFPERLMELLEMKEVQHIISWLPHGRSFMILRPKVFASEIMPTYFRQAKYASFTRRLNRWGFRQVAHGSENGAFYHDLFLRDQPELCLKMFCGGTARRPSTKSSSSSSPLSKMSAATIHRRSEIEEAADKFTGNVPSSKEENKKSSASEKGRNKTFDFVIDQANIKKIQEQQTQIHESASIYSDESLTAEIQPKDSKDEQAFAAAESSMEDRKKLNMDEEPVCPPPKNRPFAGKSA